MSLLTDKERLSVLDNYELPKEAYRLCLDIESAVLEKLKAQEPVAWRTFDGEGGYDYRCYVDNEKYQAEFLARNPSSTYKNWVEPLYLHPLPPDDVVRDPRVAELEAVLRKIRLVAPREVECHNMHHAKKDQHSFDESCPVVSRYAEAIAKIDEVLNEDR